MRKHKFIALLSLLLSGTGAMAQNAPTPAPQSSNLLETMMIIIAVVLAFVIWGMGQVLLTMGRQLLDKHKQSNNILSIIILLSCFMLPYNLFAQATTEKVAAVANYGGLSSTSFWLLATVIGIEFFAIAFMMFGIRRFQKELVPGNHQNQFNFSKWWNKIDAKYFTRAVAVEKEADVMLDHDYDGIRELDNSLPPWWKYGFYFTIVVAVIYLMNFHVLANGKDPLQEYQEEMTSAQNALEAYNAQNKDRVDENNLMISDASGIAAGKDIFNATCWTCHGKLGEGGAGPNLTDDYWIHKGGLKDVYLSIKHGYPDKGMQAWEKQYSPKEMLHLASFIKSINGSNPPNAKLPQGDLYQQENVAVAVTSVVADTTKTK